MFVFHPIREDPNSNILVWRRTKKAATSYQLHLAEMCLRMAEMFLAETHGMHGPFPNGRDSMAAKPSAAARRKFSPRKSQTGNEDHNLGLRDTQVKSVRKLQVLYLNIPQLLCASQVDPGWGFQVTISSTDPFTQVGAGCNANHRRCGPLERPADVVIDWWLVILWWW